MPSLTARTRRRGSFAGAGLAFSAKASSEMSPGGGGVAGNPCVLSGPLPAALRAPGVGMKPPRFAVWMFGQLGARAGDELVDLYPGSGAITEAWRRCTGALRVTGDVGDVDARRVASSGMCAPAKRRYDVAVVGHEQVLSGQRRPVRVGRVYRRRLHRRGRGLRRGAGGCPGRTCAAPTPRWGSSCRRGLSARGRSAASRVRTLMRTGIATRPVR